MEKAEHNEQLGFPTPGFVLANVANMRRVMQPDPEYQALCCNYFRDTFWLVFLGGYRRKCLGQKIKKAKTDASGRNRPHVLLNLLVSVVPFAQFTLLPPNSSDGPKDGHRRCKMPCYAS
ncbi:unnamed protein product [Sphacelaria rigidula]